MSDLLSKEELEEYKKQVGSSVNVYSDGRFFAWLSICAHIEEQSKIMDECELTLGIILRYYALLPEHRLAVESLVKKLESRE